jgi:hypothetical protein
LTEIDRARGSGIDASTSRWKRITSKLPKDHPLLAEGAERRRAGA